MGWIGPHINIWFDCHDSNYSNVKCVIVYIIKGLCMIFSFGDWYVLRLETLIKIEHVFLIIIRVVYKNESTIKLMFSLNL